MTQHLAQRGALAAARNENAFGCRMREHGSVHQRLVVDPLVGRRALHFAVEHERAAKRLALNHFDLLKLALAVVQVLVHRRIDLIAWLRGVSRRAKCVRGKSNNLETAFGRGRRPQIANAPGSKISVKILWQSILIFVCKFCCLCKARARKMFLFRSPSSS